jgi:hypothetical protein
MEHEIKIKTTLVMPEEMKKELRLRVVQDGYGLRGKSKWVSEAITKFLELDSFHDFVEISEGLNKLTDPDTMVIDGNLEEMLNQAVIEVRKIQPLMEGVRSKIIRAAILQRFVRG